MKRSENEQKLFFDNFVVAIRSQVPRGNFWKAYSEKHVFESIEKFSKLSRHDLILEIGCGSGYYFSAFSSFRSGSFVIGADISIENLKKCNNDFKEFSFVLCDGNYLPFKSNIFDGILMISLLHHVPNYERTLAESMKVMKPGGYALIIDLTSTNLLINFARRMWFLLPRNLKDRIGDMQFDYKIPEKYAISQKNLIRCSEKIGAAIIRVEKLHLFVFAFYYLTMLMPHLSIVFNEKILLHMYFLERKLAKGSLGKFCHVIILFLRKQVVN